MLATRSLWTFWIKIARYLAYRVEIESNTPLKPPYYITRTSSLRIWMKNVYRLLCCSTCLKLSTASNMTTYYQNCTYWVCRPSLLPGLRLTYHYASRWSGWAVTYPWLSVPQKLLLNTVTMVQKCSTNQAPPYLCNLFHDRLGVSGRSSTNMSQLNLPKCRLSTGQRSFAFRR